MFDIPPPVAAEVTVVAVSENPAWEPGVKATLVLFLGRRGDGVVEPFYVSGFASEPLPPLGSHCRLTYRKALPEQVGSRAPPVLKAPVVDGFSCDGDEVGDTPGDEDRVGRGVQRGK